MFIESEIEMKFVFTPFLSPKMCFSYDLLVKGVTNICSAINILLQSNLYCLKIGRIYVGRLFESNVPITRQESKVSGIFPSSTQLEGF